MSHDYRAYGLHIRSRIELPELTPAAPSPGGADARIDLGTVNLPASVDPDMPVWVTHDTAILQYPGTANFKVCAGRSIVIDLAGSANPSLVRLYLLGPVLAILLHQRNLLVLHASAVEMNGELVAFLGDKGAGKSTMAAAFCAAGNPLLADDLIAVDPTRNPITAHPGFPQLKLFPESAALVRANHDDLLPVHPDSPKKAFRPEQSAYRQKPLKLQCAFVLKDADENSVRRLHGPEAFMAWVGHSYLLALLKPMQSAESHFRQVMALAQRTPVMQLSRRRSLSALPEVVKLVEKRLERAA